MSAVKSKIKDSTTKTHVLFAPGALEPFRGPAGSICRYIQDREYTTRFDASRLEERTQICINRISRAIVYKRSPVSIVCVFTVIDSSMRHSKTLRC